MQDWKSQTAADLGRGIAAGEIDPLALTQSYLDAIEAHPLGQRIYARVTAERALSEAAAASERAKTGQRLSLLDGVPISWKDLFDSANVATEAGSALIAGRTPTADAKVLRNATALGLVCLGKTHLSELAFSGLGLNPVTETPPCVNDLEAVSGGSSSGSATSVAFGLAASSVGSDTGGSVRIPSAWNDLVGLKTTSDRVSLEGVVALCARFDTVGPIGRSVEDAALMLSALEGKKPVDLRGAALAGKRFAVLHTMALDDLRPEPQKAFEQSLDKLKDAGAILEPVETPEVIEAMDLAGILYTAEAYGTWGPQIEAQPDLMFDKILERFRSGADYLAADYVAAWQKLERLRAQWNARLAGFDGILCPTAPILPPNIERLMRDDEYYITENLLALRNTRIGNLMGGCGISLPTGVPSCGLLVNGLPFQEEKLLRVAAAMEPVLRA
ncbi:MAG: amidase [Thalassovita sp.]